MNMAGPMGVGNMAQRPVLLRMLWVAYYGAVSCAERPLAASSVPRNWCLFLGLRRIGDVPYCARRAERSTRGE